MSHDLMTQCEQKKRFRLSSNLEWRWIMVPVSLLGTTYEAIRCMHCHGAVRVHKQKIDRGSEDHVEHRLHQDSEHCLGSIHFQGEHRISLQPVQ